VADAALAKYTARPGFAFREPLCDRAGPNRRPDIYVKRIQFGLAVEATRAAGGPFVLVAPTLDPSRAQSTRSLRLIVAHELFHLVQFAYMPGGMPRWVAEGTANAMGIFLAQTRSDVLTIDALFAAQTDRWLRQPWISLYDEAANCGTCYGGGLWWLHAIVALERADLITLYFERLAATRLVGLGIDTLALTVQNFGERFDQLFNRIAAEIYGSGIQVRPRLVVDANAVSGRTADQRLLGLSTHYIPVRTPPGAAGIDVTIEALEGSSWVVRMRAGGPRGVDLQWFQPDSAHVVYRPRFATDGRDLMIILTNGFERSSRYAISWELR
jgi:hypothetical protein